MRKSLLFALAIPAGMASPAAAESWYLVSVSASHSTITYVDVESITQLADSISVDMLIGYRDGMRGYPGIRYVETRQEIRCVQRQFHTRAVIGFGSDRSVVATDGQGSGWEPVGNYSNAELTWSFACRGAHRDTPVADPFADADSFFSSDAAKSS